MRGVTEQTWVVLEELGTEFRLTLIPDTSCNVVTVATGHELPLLLFKRV